MKESHDIARVVSYASASGAYGGPLDTALRQSDVAVANGWRVRVLAGTTDDDRPSPDSLAELLFIPVRRVLPLRGFTALFSARLAVQLVRAISTSSVVHVSIAREMVPLWALLVGLIFRKRVVLQPHGMLTARTSRMHAAADFILRPLASRASSVICLTEDEKRDLQSWFRGRTPPIVVVGNPLPRTLPVATDSYASNEALFVARLHPRKRVDVFANAAGVALENGWTETYTAIGPDEGELPGLRARLDRDTNFNYEGTLPGDEVATRVNRAAVFVLPSWREPWGNVLVSALALGKPVIVSASAALAPRVTEFRAGEIVPDGDPQALAAAVHRLLSSKVIYDQASQGALTLAKALFSSEAQNAALGTAYDLSATTSA